MYLSCFFGGGFEFGIWYLLHKCKCRGFCYFRQMSLKTQRKGINCNPLSKGGQRGYLPIRWKHADNPEKNLYDFSPNSNAPSLDYESKVFLISQVIMDWFIRLNLTLSVWDSVSCAINIWRELAVIYIFMIMLQFYLV